MKLLKKLGIISLTVLFSACSSDDDNSGGMQGDIDVLSVLTSGKWYQETITPGSFTDCEKNTSIEFATNGIVTIDTYDDQMGPCESLGAEAGSYTLTNNRDLLITSDVIVISVVIDSITEELLTITTTDGEILTFDKVQG